MSYALLILKNWKQITLALVFFLSSFISYNLGIKKEKSKCDAQLQDIKIEEQQKEIELQSLQIQSKQNVIKIKNLQSKITGSISNHADNSSRLKFMRIIFQDENQIY